ncbi:raffinose/stachyose/melibiose transport system permease protein [Actinoplanes lutulentus]|uniref:Carbohydrate ABC transporter membrane protein 2 (CUT1 family) n=1 Tax=Actinoplanes lutulentus TaxID=1287878 RepID=A0A327ZC30_9ACTN|nr:carbohydrate ABC transporter permease [Actinoplanes lutulentus]MBB2941328.1 raffinose/stachyose/melibiose transport system permease protein [Actinoplanes lutulentus]RAK36820.1 carbohydrate ABC transporter membrane protein 2 (CUT1 family) [Actinoplanes lutulentus]
MRRFVLGVYALLIVVPLVVIVGGSFKTTPELFASPFGLPKSPTLDNYTTVLAKQDMLGVLGNSLFVVSISVPVTLLLGSLVAFAVARLPRWPSRILFAIFAAGLAVPAQAVMIPQYVQFERLGLRNSLTGLILVNIVVTLPVAVFILAGFMRTLPAELYEAAELDGAGPWASYRRIAVPVSYPSLAATAIFLIVMHWNDLLYPLLFIDDPDKRTLPLALLDFQGEYLTEYPLLFTGVVVASLPMVLAYAFLQRHFVAGITAGAVKG